jgi:hypothetical protein
MQKQGLRVLKYGRQKFVKGSDLIAFLEGRQTDGSDLPSSGGAADSQGNGHGSARGFAANVAKDGN